MMESFPSRVKAHSTATEPSSRQALTAYWRRGIMHSRHTSDRHMISPVFAVTEPTALPTAISALPSKAANTDTIISGMVVAKLTTVAPIMNFGMRDASAIHVAAMHSSPAANSSRTKKRFPPVKSIPIVISFRLMCKKETFARSANVMC